MHDPAYVIGISGYLVLPDKSSGNCRSDFDLHWSIAANNISRFVECTFYVDIHIGMSAYFSIAPPTETSKMFIGHVHDAMHIAWS